MLYNTIKPRGSSVYMVAVDNGDINQICLYVTQTLTQTI